MKNFNLFAIGASALAMATSAPAFAASSVVTKSFIGDTITSNVSVGGGFIPPDTMGAVGTTQFVELVNGSFTVFDKGTGAKTKFVGDSTFWGSVAGITDFNGATAGGVTGGDPRIMFNATYNRWIATSFGGDLSYLNIAVSDTADATGAWKGTTYSGFQGVGGNGIADFDTLAMDRNAVYTTTNNFLGSGSCGAGGQFCGTTINVIPIGDIFKASLAAPDVSNKASFVQTFTGSAAGDRGYAIQGVNSNSAGTSGTLIADGNFSNGVATKINNAGLGSGGASVGSVTNLAVANFDQNVEARQPDGSRNLDSGDTRIASSVYELNGNIYFARTVTPTGSDHNAVRITVLKATDFSVLQELDIAGGGDFDYFQPAFNVSAFGAVLEYNRSGGPTTGAFGAVSIYANAYTLDSAGLLVFDATHLLKQGDNTGYFIDFGSGRNRWGDYAAVTVDPTDASTFWVIGEYATTSPYSSIGNDGWGTWISAIKFNVGAVPEPATWAQMLLGFGLIGGAIRRKRVTNMTYSVA